MLVLVKNPFQISQTKMWVVIAVMQDNFQNWPKVDAETVTFNVPAAYSSYTKNSLNHFSDNGNVPMNPFAWRAAQSSQRPSYKSKQASHAVSEDKTTRRALRLHHKVVDFDSLVEVSENIRHNLHNCSHQGIISL